MDADDRDANDLGSGVGAEPVEGHGFEPYDQEGESLLGGDEPPAASSGPPAPPARKTRPVSEAPAAPLALYRRYRPDTFAEVIGQGHVTDPLQRALSSNRVNHAYLFSGPRGCGKTTSARILARCLNCVQGPTPTPCGECQSCRDLARGGPGSIDVIEIDAASHGGVDDARDLRERAFFAPVHSRYKVYIVDEAHMVTTAGFNAMLKLVEEPPPHVKFIFATTEPDKVIGTIRSRTHHYPFRLVPPKTLQGYLAELCAAEGIAVEPTVLPLVVRAGAGSVRDSLSVLDQLLGGAAESGVSYAQAAALLGYTPESLLDEIVDAFAAGDAAGVFACIDKVMEVGQDPRRFGEDLLHRLRDLVIVSAVPDAIASGLVDVAGDQAERLLAQAGALGRGELTRAAEVLATGLTDMRGTTAPRLHLELMCARVLLPGADVDERGFHARLDRLERRLAGLPVAPVAEMGAGGQPHDASSAPAAPAAPAGPVRQGAPATPASGGSSPATARPAAEQTFRLDPSPPSPAQHRQAVPPPAAVSEGVLGAGAPAGSTPTGGAVPAAGPGLKVADIRRLWPDVLEEVKNRRRFTWILMSQNAQVADVHDGVLTLAMKNEGARDRFAKGGNEDVLRDAIVEVLRVDLRIQTMVDGSSAPAQHPPVHHASSAPQRAGPPAPLRTDGSSPGQEAGRDQDSVSHAPAAASHATSPPSASRPSAPLPSAPPSSSPPPSAPLPSAPPSSSPPPSAPSTSAPSPKAPPPSAPPPKAPPPNAPPPRAHGAGAPSATSAASGASGVRSPNAVQQPASPPPTAERSAAALARDRIMPTRGYTPDEPPPEDEPPYDPFDDIEDGEADADPHQLLAKHLGAEQIAEEDDSSA